MEQLIDPAYYAEEVAAARRWLEANAVAVGVTTLVQLLVIGLAFYAARLGAPRLRAMLAKTARGRFEPQIVRLTRALEPLALPIIWLALLWLAVLLASGFNLPLQVMKTVVSLLTAWVIIRFTSALVRDPLWSRFIAVVAWVIAALSILGLLAPTMAALDSVAINMGELRVSALTVVKAVLSLALLLWIATLAGRVLEQRITSVVTLTPSIQVLITKLLKIVLVVIAVFVALRSVGIDLTAFAVLTGAIGVGIGFGLQKMVSNFVSGITILLDKSIKPGDVLVVGDSYGRVASLGARYVSLITRDGVEFLIPNEELVTQQVINWSYSSDQVRLKVPVGIDYSSDVRRAMALCVEAAQQVERVLKHPAPVCLLKGFGDNSVDLELRFWIHDPMNGVSNVKSEVMLHIWDSFHANRIAFPYPQQDLHFKTPLEVRMREAGESQA
jgi:small-conductance mechanosensitive channel